MKKFLLLAVLSVAAAHLQAGVLYSNLGAGDSYSTSGFTTEDGGASFSDGTNLPLRPAALWCRS